MTSAHGNKGILTTVCICLAAFSLITGSLIAEKKSRIRYFEKKYSSFLSSLKSENMQICTDCKVSFIDEAD